MELVVTLLAISVMIGMGQSTEKWTPKAKSCTAASTKDVSRAMSAAMEVQSTLKAHGFTDEDIKKAGEWAATDLKCTSNIVLSEIQPNDIQAKVSSYGRLIIESEPRGATVDVDGRRWDDKTNTRGFADAGLRTIRLTWSGQMRLETKCDIRSEKVTKLHVTQGFSGECVTE